MPDTTSSHDHITRNAPDTPYGLRQTGPPILPPATQEATPTVVTPAPSAAPTPTPDVSAVPTGTPPTGGFTVAELRHATVTIGAWTPSKLPEVASCPTGQVPLGDLVYLIASDGTDLRYADVDRDGKFETIAAVGCGVGGETRPDQLLVFGRGANNSVRTLGSVVKTVGDVVQIDDFAGLTDGTIRALVNNTGLCCDNPYTGSQHQWRTFAWDATMFQQTGGMTAFYPDSVNADLEVTASKLVLGRKTNGVRTGTVTFTVRNAGPNEVADFTARLVLGQGFEFASATGWTQTQHVNPSGPFQWIVATRPFGHLAPGESRQITVTVTTGLDNISPGAVNMCSIPLAANGDEIRDTNPRNNGEENGRLYGVPPTEIVLS